MSLRRPHLAWLAAFALAGSACNLIFGVHEGQPGSGGALPDGGLPDGDPADGEVTDAPPDHAGDSGSCTAGEASCEGATLHLCDAQGHPQSLACGAVAACDAPGRRCLDATTTRLAVGHGRGCVVDDARQVRCWGQNYGLLWSDNHNMLPAATLIPGVGPARQVMVADATHCALHDDGSVVCWGGNQDGEAGQPPGGVVEPGPVPLGAPALELRGADACSCARLADGTVWCWGSTTEGCFGPPPDGGAPQQYIPARVGDVHDAAELHVGSDWWPTCVRHATGKVTCWTADMPPTEVPGIAGALEIGIGPKVVFARTASGVVRANLTGDPPTTWTTAAAYEVPHPSPVTAVRVAQSFCALHQDGAISCSVLDDAGHGDAPATVGGLPAGKLAELAVGAGISYGTDLQCLRVDGAPLAGHVYCWGDDSWGGLGAGAPHVVKMPATLPGLTGMATLTASVASTVGVSTDGRVWTWGLTPGLRTSSSAAPSLATALGNTNAFAAQDPGASRAYLLATDGSARMLSWALPDPGARLTGTASFTGYTWIMPNNHWDLALLADGRVVAYGDSDDANVAGIFGNGTTTSAPGDTSVVQGLGAARKVAAYGDVYNTARAHACAIVGSPGALWCWGDNGYSELTGTATDSVPTPRQISLPGNDPVVDVASGRAHTCAVGASGAVSCWGYNDLGQLGYDTGGANQYPLPDVVTGVTNAVSIAAGEAHTCAVLTDKTVICWGVNDRAQLGDDTFDDRWEALPVPGLKNVAQVTASLNHTCARHTDGTVSCWGSSYYGQVGSGVTGRFPEPRQVGGL